MFEVLACADSAEAVIAAVQSGANSICIRFGSRAAKGFGEAALAKSARYCRIRGCRLYIELDTLMADSETAAAAALVKRGCELGVDGFIAQDLGFILIARAVAPDTPVFAGERLDLHNAAGLDAVRQLGVSRVFLPRELPLSAIRKLAGHGVELAVCVRGEMCASRPGQCWLSALTGGGSANRSGCSGVCREAYSLGGRMDDYPLATKPLDYTRRLSELADAGVSCVTLGRGERPERLAALTRVISRCSREGRDPTAKELDELAVLDAYREHTDAFLNGEPEKAAGLVPAPERDDERAAAAAMRAERARYGKIELRRVKVNFFLAAKPGMPILAGVQDTDGNSAELKGPVAGDVPGIFMTGQSVTNELRRTAGTPYHCERVLAMVPPGMKAPPDTVPALRARLVHALTEKRAAPRPRRTEALPAPGGPIPPAERLTYCVELMRANQLSDELLELRPDCLCLPLTECAEASGWISRFASAGVSVLCAFPRVIYDSELAAVGDMLRQAKAAGATQALVGSLGHVALARLAGLDVRGDFGLNIFNSYAVQAAAGAGLLSVTASFELTLAQIKRLGGALPLEIIGYGRLPAMLTERCVIDASAHRCVCDGDVRISDAHGHFMPVIREYPCRNAIYGPEKVFMADRTAELLAAGVQRFRLLFTNEGAREVCAVYKACTGQSAYRPNGLTRGFYYKGVE